MKTRRTVSPVSKVLSMRERMVWHWLEKGLSVSEINQRLPLAQMGLRQKAGGARHLRVLEEKSSAPVALSHIPPKPRQKALSSALSGRA